MSFCSTILSHPAFLHQNEGVNEGVNEVLGEKEQIVLNAMKLNPSISTAKMVAELGISKASVERSIRSLKEKGIIVREGAFKNGRWIIL